ncbi:MAG: GAF domain-containing sensor histidine kinase [Chloroflexi bacterium]|nr:GAF domain-containing sensor histidine kinase [Chloroflexota bacterium]
MTEDQSKILERLLDLTRNLSTMVDLETYLQSILSAATELTDSETASLMEFDEATQEFRFKQVPWFHREALNSATVPVDKSAAGWIFLHVKPLIINDVQNDPRYYRKIDELANFTTHSLMGVPLIFHGRPLGVLEVFNKAGGVHYNGEDVAVVESLASLATMAMQNDALENTALSSQNEARDLDRLKNEFIAITSHELRTPLGLILGHSTFLRELVGNDYQEQVEAIIRNATRLKEIIENLSRVDNYQTGGASLRARKISVNRIVEDVAASFRDMAAQKGVSLKVKAERGQQDLIVNADGSKVAIVLSNLVKNALTFTNKGGQVTIRAGLDSGFVKVVVEDSGVGIPPQDLPHVFERFYQVESHLTRRHGGMGLGLSVAKAMIEMHGGRIWAASVEGKGSTFTFLLPLELKNGGTAPLKPFTE